MLLPPKVKLRILFSLRLSYVFTFQIFCNSLLIYYFHYFMHYFPNHLLQKISRWFWCTQISPQCFCSFGKLHYKQLPSIQEQARWKKKRSELSKVEVTQSEVPAQHGQFSPPTQLCHSLNTSMNWVISLIQQREEEEITDSCWRTAIDSLTMHLVACHYGQTNYKQWKTVTLSLFWKEKKPHHI